MKENNISPVVIGALGGSGTRVFAQILRELDYYIGNQLNEPLDNLVFSRLFRIPELYSFEPDKHTHKRMGLFNSYMRGNNISPNEIITLVKCNNINKFYKNDLMHLYLTIINNPGNIKWGWKSPVSQLYIPHLKNYFKNFRYIHILRDGKDMTFSKNRNQLNIWGELFNIESTNYYSQQLEFWYKSTKNAIQHARELLREDFLLIHFEEFCLYPDKEIKKILSFLNIEYTTELIERLGKMVKIPNTYKRHEAYSYKFNKKEKKYLEEINEICKPLL